MARKVRVIYDFQAETDSELSAAFAEELTVLDDQTYDGWYMVRNRYGNEGIVPASYVEYIGEAPPPPSLPPPPPMSLSSSSSHGWNSNINNSNQFTTDYSSSSNYNTAMSNLDLDQLDFFGSSNNTISPAVVTTPSRENNAPASYTANSLFSFDDFTTTPTATNSVVAPDNYSISSGSNINNNKTVDQYDDSDFDDEPSPPKPQPSNQFASPTNQSIAYDDSDKYNTMRSNSIGGPSMMGSGTIRHKPKNSFGLEAYLFVGPIKPIKDSEKLSTIILDENGQPQWQRKSPPYNIKITNFTSGNKYKGLKTYTAYTLQANIFSYSVSRRYKQFDWLHERLMDKYPNLCIPPLPDKAVTGRFEEDFINKRKAQLELWLNRMSLHPVVNQSEVFIHFLQCKDADTSKWKEGKRKHEKDEFRNAQWLCSINVPAVSCGTSNKIKEQIDKFSKAAVAMDGSLKNLVQGVDKLAQTHATIYKKEVTYVGKKFEEFGTSISNDALSTPKDSSHNKLCDALRYTGATYVEIANNYGEQHKHDAMPLLENLTLYRGILHEMPEVVNFDKNAIQIYEELQQKPDKQNYNTGDIMNRLDVANYATLAEINFFNSQKVHDYNAYMRAYLSKQIEFYSEITEKLKKAYAQYDVPPN